MNKQRVFDLKDTLDIRGKVSACNPSLQTLAVMKQLIVL
jgi:hypothetical protein